MTTTEKIRRETRITDYDIEPLMKSLRQLHANIDRALQIDPTRKLINGFKLPEQFFRTETHLLPATTNEMVMTFYPSDALIDLVAATGAKEG